MNALLSLKNSYYMLRLAPFLIVYVAYELIEVAILAFLQGTGTDWNVPSILQLLGNLVLETCSSFLYLIIPYLLIWLRSLGIPRRQDGPCAHCNLLCILLHPEQR